MDFTEYLKYCVRLLDFVVLESDGIEIELMPFFKWYCRDDMSKDKLLYNDKLLHKK